MKTRLVPPSCLALLSWLGAAAPVGVARADDAHPTQVDDASRLYDEARDAFQEGHDDVALDRIEASLRLLDSPNSELLRAHVLHRQRRLVDAHASYERALRGATLRLQAGEARFEPTVAEAGRSLALLRTKLGEIQIVVRGTAEAIVEVGDRRLALTARDGGDHVGSAWLPPGTIEVRAVSGGSTRRSQARLEASRRTDVLLDFSPPPVEAPLAPTSSGGAPPLGTWIAAGVGVAGGVVFGVFGGLALGVDDDLATCSPRCPEARRIDADRGRAFQTTANVGLVVGVAGLTTAAVVWIVDAATGTDSTATPGRSANPFAFRF